MWSVPSVCSFTPGVHYISLGRMDDDDSQLVLRRIMEDGTFDELRKTVIERLKQDVRGPVAEPTHYGYAVF